MGLKSVMAYIKSRAADTPDTPEKITGYQPKPAWIKACTPDTPDTSENTDSRENFQTRPFGEAVNDPASPKPGALKQAGSEWHRDPDAWRELAQAYHAHHFKCPVCIAAGRGAGYGLRCGAGAALWQAYQDSS